MANVSPAHPACRPSPLGKSYPQPRRLHAAPAGSLRYGRTPLRRLTPRCAPVSTTPGTRMGTERHHKATGGTRATGGRPTVSSPCRWAEGLLRAPPSAGRTGPRRTRRTTSPRPHRLHFRAPGHAATRRAPLCRADVTEGRSQDDGGTPGPGWRAGYGSAGVDHVWTWRAVGLPGVWAPRWALRMCRGAPGRGGGVCIRRGRGTEGRRAAGCRQGGDPVSTVRRGRVRGARRPVGVRCEQAQGAATLRPPEPGVRRACAW